MQQLADDVFNVFTHIARFSQGRSIGHHKRHIQHTRHGLRQQRFARASRANQQNVALGQFHIVFILLVFMPQTLVMVVNRYSQGALGHLLPNNVVIQIFFDLRGRGQLWRCTAASFSAKACFLLQHTGSTGYALITNKCFAPVVAT